MQECSTLGQILVSLLKTTDDINAWNRTWHQASVGQICASLVMYINSWNAIKNVSSFSNNIFWASFAGKGFGASQLCH